MSARTDRPATANARFVTDGGMETDLIFHHGVELPEFAAYPLLGSDTGRGLLSSYYAGYAEIARAAGVGLVLESPTWRANPDWGARLGDDRRALGAVNTEAIRFLHGLRDTYRELAAVHVCGMIGPRGDGYVGGTAIDPAEAARYHRPQLEAFALAGADRAAAYTLTDPGEAIGIAQASAELDLPVWISFTVETDGRLPGGVGLAQAMDEVLAVATPQGFQLNCAHPTHLGRALADVDEATRQRIVGVRANASVKTHAELDEATELDEGDLVELVDSYTRLTARLPNLQVVGGCCGTDTRHVAALWGITPPTADPGAATPESR